MNLLHFGLFFKQEPQMGLRNALRSISTKYIEFSWIAKPQKAMLQLHQLISIHQPDTVFMQIQTPGIVRPDFLARYKSIRFFNFNGDVRPEIPKWHFDVAPYCTTLFTNTDWVEKVPGAKYMQVSCSLDIYKPEGKKLITRPVVFLGNNHGSQFPLSAMRGELRDKLNEVLQVYGRGWGVGVTDLNYKQQEEAAVYRGSKIGINLSHMDLGSYSSDRLYRLMACGTMCLAYRHKDIHKEFIEGLHLRTWRTLDELQNLVSYYLENDSARINIARNGCELIHKKYNWTERLKPILL